MAVNAAILHALALARLSLVAARGSVVKSRSGRVRLRAELAEAIAELAMLREELRIKDERIARLDPRRRPHYPAADRLAILALRAARGWTLTQTAARMFVEAKTLAAWLARVDEQGVDALVRTSVPINRFPRFVEDIVRRMKTLCPAMGKKRIAETLARAGVHLGVSTVSRMLKRRVSPRSAPASEPKRESGISVRATRPNEVWQTDLTTVPTAAGLWVPWLPFTLHQRWPFAWCVAAVVDTFSRRVIGFRVFDSAPTASDLRPFFAQCIRTEGERPRYLVSDKGSQFTDEAHRRWCKKLGVVLRYAATGSRRATAIIERFFRSMKTEWLRRIQIPLRAIEMHAELQRYVDWYHTHRPHQGLRGRTPSEVFSGDLPANEMPRFEPRARWPRKAPCAKPFAKPKRGQGGRLGLSVEYADPRKTLPVFRVERAP